MTCIANYPTKKAFKAAAANGQVNIEDPSIVAPYYGSLQHYMVNNAMCTITNPKRSWYACVTKRANGDLKID